MLRANWKLFRVRRLVGTLGLISPGCRKIGKVQPSTNFGGNRVNRDLRRSNAVILLFGPSYQKQGDNHGMSKRTFGFA